jgi:GLPGLI family protein
MKIGKNYLVNHNWRKIINTNWEIFNDTLNVAGYTCTKAINDSGIVAWFTDSIPVNSGPMSYHGLPGLILQVNDGIRKQIISAKAITKTSAKIIFPKKYAVVDKDEYKRFVEKNRPANNITIYRWNRND